MEIKSESGCFLLRNWELTDVDSLSRHMNDVKIWNNLRDGLPSPYLKEDAERYIRVTMAQPYVQNWAIVVDGEAVGGVGIVPLGDVERFTAELGYWLGVDYWNRGIVTEAVRLVVRHVFSQTEIIRLFALVYEYNLNSVRVLEKAGFEKQAVLRKAAVKNGKIIDMHYFDRVKE